MRWIKYILFIWMCLYFHEVVDKVIPEIKITVKGYDYD